MIIVFGSINTDMVFPVKKLPQPGETVLGPGYETYFGGKGANQALAAARMGARVALIGRVGDDGMGLRMLTVLRRDGVITSGVTQSNELPTGCAIIAVDEGGENQIIVASGANAEVSQEQIPDEILKPDNYILMQMEVPAEENWTLLERAHEKGVKTILNLAPAISVSQRALDKLDYLVVNQLEARQMADMLGIKIDDDASKLARALSQQGKLTCIITMGEQGSIAVTAEGEEIRVPAVKLDDPVDKTGAGDAYCGTLTAALHDGKSLKEAMRYAAVAGSLTCTKKGAQDSLPYLAEIQDNLETLPE